MDPRAVALVPLFLYTNWCYNYQFIIFNDPLFNTPTKGLNNVFYWGAQMLSAWLLGLYHDTDQAPRTRAYVSLAFIGAICLATWFGGVYANSLYGLSSCPAEPNHPCSCYQDPDHPDDPSKQICPDLIQFSQFGRWIFPLGLYTMWGACDALVQCWSYWILGQLSDRPEILSRYSGWYKTWNSLGNALGAALITATGKDLQLWINIGLFAVALPPAAYVCSTVADRKRVASSAAQPLSDA